MTLSLSLCCVGVVWCAQLKAECDQERAKFDAEHQQCDELRVQHTEVADALELLQQEHAGMQAELQNQHKDMLRMQTANKVAAQNNARLQRELDQAVDQRDAHREDAARAGEEVQQLKRARAQEQQAAQHELARLKAQLQALKKALEAARDDKQALQESLAQQREAHASRCAELHAQVDKLTTELEATRAEASRHDHTKQKLAAQLTAAAAQVQRLSDDLDAESDRAMTAEKALSACEKGAARSGQALQAATEDGARAKALLKDAKAEIESLKVRMCGGERPLWSLTVVLPVFVCAG